MIENDIPENLVTRIKYKYWEIWPYDLRPGVMWYNFKCWVWHRYGTIRCRRLPHTWSDRRTILLHASFQILTDFIDKECSPGHVEWYGEYAHQIEVGGVMENVMDEMKELYRWWNTVHEKEYPERCDELWEAIETCSPKIRCVPYKDMPDYIAGKMMTEYEDDEQRGKHKTLTEELRNLDRYMDKQAEEMLKRLAAVRLWMWT